MTTDSPTTAGSIHVDKLMRLRFPRGKGSETTTKNDKMQNPLDIRVFWAGHSRSHLESPACLSAGVRPLARRRRSRKEIQGAIQCHCLVQDFCCQGFTVVSEAVPTLIVVAVRARRIRGLTAFGSPEECCPGDVVGTMSDEPETDYPRSRYQASRWPLSPEFIDDSLDTAASLEHPHGLVEDSKTVAPDFHYFYFEKWRSLGEVTREPWRIFVRHYRMRT